VSSLVHIIENDCGQLEASVRAVGSVGLQVKGYPSAGAFLRTYRPTQAACVVVDLSTPEMSGEELRSRVSRGGARPPFIFMSGSEDISVAVNAMRNGARDVLQKPIDAETLIDAISSALESPSSSQHVRAFANERLYALSARELEVFAHVVRGEIGCSIARELAITVRTVKAHRAMIKRKLGTRSVALWARLAAEAGFSILPITPPALCGRGGARWKRTY